MIPQYWAMHQFSFFVHVNKSNTVNCLCRQATKMTSPPGLNCQAKARTKLQPQKNKRSDCLFDSVCPIDWKWVPVHKISIGHQCITWNGSYQWRPESKSWWSPCHVSSCSRGLPSSNLPFLSCGRIQRNRCHNASHVCQSTTMAAVATATAIIGSLDHWRNWRIGNNSDWINFVASSVCMHEKREFYFIALHFGEFKLSRSHNRNCFSRVCQVVVDRLGEPGKYQRTSDSFL